MIKIAIVGDQQVGKTSLNQRFSNHTFNASPIYNCDFYKNKQKIDENEYNIQTWHYNYASSRYYPQQFLYRNTKGVIICYAINDRNSFNNISKYIEQIKSNNNDNNNNHNEDNKIQYMIVGTKCDLENERQISYAEGLEYANSLGVQFIETSSLDNINVESAFMKLIRLVIESNQIVQAELPQNHNSNNKNNKCACNHQKKQNKYENDENISSLTKNIVSLTKLFWF